MPRLYLHRSNRLELLASKLAELMKVAPPADPMAPVTVVVQTPGVARWLSMRLADELGCCMNIDYPYPRGFVENMLELWLGAPPGQLDELSLAWRIYGLLPELAQDRTFDEVRHYLADGQQIKRMQLAERLAQLFDQYATYRHQMLMEWEKGKRPEDWQAQLWRKLVGETAGPFQHIARVMLKARDRAPANRLPERVYVFGVSTLPPLYLEFFQQLGRHAKVYLLQLDPTEEYWGDLQAKRVQLREQLELGLEEQQDEGVIQQPLLASLGKQGRDFSSLLINNQFQDATPHGTAAFPKAPETLLGELQNDILELRDRSDPQAEKLPGRDDTILFAACHSPMREVEVLKDHLLGLFETIEDLKPRDVLVLTPDIEKMAPYVEAVFGCPESGQDALPYSVADRGPRGESKLIDAFFEILELPHRRMTAREVLAVLEHEAVRIRFDFEEAALERIREWLRDVRVCWGRDASHREELGMGLIEQNSWRAGLDRLLLGIAMRGRDELLYDGRLPYDEIEGDAVDLAGKLCEAVDGLLRLTRQMESPMPLAAWRRLLEEVVTALLDSPEGEEDELRLLRETIAELEACQAHLVDPQAPVNADVVRHVLEGVLRERRPAGAFLGGRITFAELKPMRSVPARVICMIGMDDGAFPRRDVRLPFDFIAQDPKLGDRSLRLGDRYLFLETLLSARDRLYISYLGQGKDGGDLPPSVCVSELLDYLVLSLGGDGSESPEDVGLLVRHRIHPFNPDYFSSETSLSSFSSLNLRAANALLGPRANPPFIGRRLPMPGDAGEVVQLEEFTRFFADPGKHFLANTLKLRLPQDEAPLPEDEPARFEGLDRYSVADGILQQLLEGEPPGSINEGLLKARGLLPWTDFGRMAFNDQFARAYALYEKIVAHTGSMQPSLYEGELELQLETGRLRLRFSIGNVFGNGRLVCWKMGKLSSKDRLKAWLSFLPLCAHGSARELVIIGEEAIEQVSPDPNPLETLTRLARRFVQGACEPLPFYQEIAYEGLKPIKKKDSSPEERALKTWLREPYGDAPPVCRELPTTQLIYRDKDPFPEKLPVLLEIGRDVWDAYFENKRTEES